jgi:hypothetical protein
VKQFLAAMAKMPDWWTVAAELAAKQTAPMRSEAASESAGASASK